MMATDDRSPLAARAASQTLSPRRLLVIRLDRIGDVVLSTPVLGALRRRFPHLFIGMMVRPPCRELIEGHPHVDQPLIYEKEGAHHGVLASIRFARGLRQYEFDTALILHPSNRSHWIPWLARIPVRVGYDRKLAGLLTHRVAHRKQEGERHEAAYTLDLLRLFGIQPGLPQPLIPIHERAIRRVEGLLTQAGIQAGEPLVALHPSASCISKRWPAERFAQVADRLMAERGVRLCLVAGEADAWVAGAVVRMMRVPAINFAGALGIGELAALLRRCRLLLSNDSGPVHIAAAVGTPVVDIFGRNQRGLSPRRWGPLGEGHVILHKEVGCVTCLAHACDIDFLCLTSLAVEEVYQAAVSVLDAPNSRPS